jgi:hypothetical protein
LECVCLEETALRRLAADAEGHPAGNRDFQLYLEVRARFEAIAHVKTVIDTERPLETCVEQALAALRSSGVRATREFPSPFSSGQAPPSF